MYHCSVFLEHYWFQERWRQQTTVVSRLTATFFRPGEKAIHFLDCEQSLLFFRFSERNARAWEWRSRETRETRAAAREEKRYFLIKKKISLIWLTARFLKTQTVEYFIILPHTATYSKFRKSKCVWHVILIGQVGYTCSCFVFRLKCISDGLITDI